VRSNPEAQAGYITKLTGGIKRDQDGIEAVKKRRWKVREEEILTGWRRAILSWPPEATLPPARTNSPNLPEAAISGE